MSTNDPTTEHEAPDGVDWKSRASTLASELSEARREAAGYRTGTKGQFAEAGKSLAALAGVNPDAPDRPEVAQLVKLVQGQIRELKVRAGLAEAMHKHGAKPGLTRAYLLDSGALKKLDPDASDFHEVLDDALTEAFENEPALRGGGHHMPSRSPIDFGTGAPGGQSPAYTKDEVAAMSPEEVVRLHRSGRLNHLKGGNR